ncbi:MAG: OmpH family outer membrane protein [Flavobacteriaceae bacterium]|nr:OmpH family outer membrane protein [Flavobacteriaceae bacterium]
MRKHFLLILASLFTSLTFSQTKGVKIGYIDIEYILQNVPSYTEAKNQLELKAQKWKQEIEVRNNEITKLKEALKAEQVLLTKELIAEKQEEITFQEKELLDYNQKRFGPNGDLIIQKGVLVKPIQDQIFTIVQDLADSKKYDFIFDKSSDLTMLFASKRYDISDLVLRTLNRAEQKEQLTKKQLKLQQEKDAKDDAIRENPEILERQKILDDKKLAREKLLAEKKAESNEKKRIAEENRKKVIDEKKALKSSPPTSNLKDSIAAKKANEKMIVETNKKAAAEARAKTLEERKKEIEDRKKKILEDREAAKKTREEKLKVKPIN